MSSLTEVRKLFDLRLDDKFKTKPDVLSFLKRHERKELVLKNLCEEIVKCERYCVQFNVNKYKSVIETVVEMFSAAALKLAEERLLSDAEKTRLIRKGDHLKEAENMMLILEKEAKDEEEKIRVFVNEHG